MPGTKRLSNTSGAQTKIRRWRHRSRSASDVLIESSSGHIVSIVFLFFDPRPNSFINNPRFSLAFSASVERHLAILTSMKSARSLAFRSLHWSAGRFAPSAACCVLPDEFLTVGG